MNIIILSENRACQVNLLIDSIHRYVRNGLVDITVLFNAHGNFNTGYKVLRENIKSSNHSVLLEETTDFKQSLLAHINTNQHELSLLLTDNMVFTREFDISLCVDRLTSEQPDLQCDCFSIINGQNICRYVDNIYESSGVDYFKPTVSIQLDQDNLLYKVAPIGYVFKNENLDSIINNTEFNDISQLQESMPSICNSAGDPAIVEFFPISICSICTYNKVDNIDIYNIIDAPHQYNVEALNTRYLLGYKINLDIYHNLISNQIHQDTDPEFNLNLKSTDVLSNINKPFSKRKRYLPPTIETTPEPELDIPEVHKFTFNDFFSLAHYINLDSRRDRDTDVKEQFKKHDLTVHRWQATVISDEESQEICKTAIPSNALKVPAQQGCALSHTKLVEFAQSGDLNNIFIFEDDVVLHDDFNRLVELTLTDLIDHDPEWDMLFLGSNPTCPIEKITPHLGRLHGAHCAQAYAVNRHFYDKVLEFTFSRSVCTDAWYNDLMRDNKCYTSLPNITWQVEGFSDLCGFNVNYKPEMDEKYSLVK